MLTISGCGVLESKMREIASEEAENIVNEYAASFAPVKFGFSGALEKEWSHSQGVKTGNMIFVTGQQPYDTNLDAEGMPLTDLETGKSFQEQLRTVLGNIEKVPDNYGATMDDVVFLQGFIDEKTGENLASFDGAAEVIREYFPRGLLSITFISDDNLFGPNSLLRQMRLQWCTIIIFLILYLSAIKKLFHQWMLSCRSEKLSNSNRI